MCQVALKIMKHATEADVSTLLQDENFVSRKEHFISCLPLVVFSYLFPTNTS